MNRTIGIVLVVLVVLGLAIYINAQRQDGMEWKDGTYIAHSKPDDRGYFGEIEVVIAKGKITKVNYEELDQQGKPKGSDYPYPPGPNSHKTYEDRLMQTQDPAKVDVVSGATETHARFKEAATEALRKAKEGDQSKPTRPAVPPSVVPMTPEKQTSETMKWKDGTYTAKTEPDDYGYYGEIELTVANGKIDKVRYDEKDKEGKPKGPEYPYPQGPESEDKYEQRLLETQDPEKVEVITGATQTWERFKETAKEALKKAQ